MNGLAGVVAAGVTDNSDAVAKVLGSVRNEHDVLVPGHEMAFACGATNDKAVGVTGNLLLHKGVICLKVDPAIGEVGRLDGSDKLKCLQLVHVS
jgi:ABC-type uncharacterized transport system ATPase subunit